MAGKNDGIINWIEPKNIGFLPSEIEEDALSVLLRILIGKVKEDHAQMQYKKELKHYAPEIIEIVRFVRQSGYEIVNVESTKYKNAYDSVKRLQATDDDNEVVDYGDSEKIADTSASGEVVEDLSFLDADPTDEQDDIDYSQIVDG